MGVRVSDRRQALKTIRKPKIFLQAQTLEVVLQIPFVRLNKASVLNIHDADQGRLMQCLNSGGDLGSALPDKRIPSRITSLAF